MVVFSTWKYSNILISTTKVGIAYSGARGNWCQSVITCIHIHCATFTFTCNCNFRDK